MTNGDAAGAVVPVPLSTLAPGSPITSGINAYPFAIAISPDASRAFTANDGGPSMSAINAATDTATAVTNANLTSPGSIAVSPDGSQVYVGNVVGTTVAVVDGGRDPSPAKRRFRIARG